jgi:hypothetical protein
VDTPNVSQVASTAPKGIDIADLIEYRKKGLSLSEIATLTGCSRENVCVRLQHADLEGLDVYRDNKDKVFEHKQREISKTLTGDKLKGMSALQAITGMAILQDKIQAMRGQATEIIEHRNITIDLSKAYEAMRASQGNTVDNPVDNLDNG